MAIHVSESEAARDFVGLLAKVRAGEEVVIGAEADPVAVLLPAVWPRPRTISECIAVAMDQQAQNRDAAILDPDFAEDVEEIVRNRKPWQPPSWD